MPLKLPMLFASFTTSRPARGGERCVGTDNTNKIHSNKLLSSSSQSVVYDGENETMTLRLHEMHNQSIKNRLVQIPVLQMCNSIQKQTVQVVDV